MAKTLAPGRVYVALEGFATMVDGIPVSVRAGDTVEEGHPFLALFPANFKAFAPTFPFPAAAERWESATAAPGEVRA